MKILQVMQAMARQCRLPVPSSITTNDDTVNELLGYIEQAAQMIYDEYSWQAVQKTGVLNVANGDQSMPLPTDYDCILTSGIYDATTQHIVLPETPDEQWIRRIGTVAADENQFRIQGRTILFTVPWDSERSLFFTYKSKNYVVTQDAVGHELYTDVFETDNDEFLLGDRLLISAAIMCRSVALMLDDAEARKNAYENILDIHKNKDSALFQGNGVSSAGRALTAQKILNYPGGSF